MSKKPHRPRPGQTSHPVDARLNPPNPVHAKIRISFERYRQGNDYCLSQCQAEQIRSFLDCLRKLTERTWQQLVDGSSKDRAAKSGLNSTPYERSGLNNPDLWPDWLERNEKILGIRASDGRRIFGVRADGAFFVIWFDSNHKIVPG